jgi:hypothetical protein
VHAVVLFRGNKGGYLVTTNGCFLGIRSEKVSSLLSVPRLYTCISDNGAAEELVMSRDAIRVISSLKGRQRDSVVLSCEV